MIKIKKILCLAFSLAFLFSYSTFASTKNSKKKYNSTSQQKTNNKKRKTTKISDLEKLLDFLDAEIEEPSTENENDYSTGGTITSISKNCSASEFELLIIAEVNLMRSNPKDYAEKYIEPLLNSTCSAYWTSCIDDMSKVGQLPELSYAEGLYKISKDHSSTQGKTGQTGHTRTNGQGWSSCVQKYGSYSYVGENISYGKSTPRDILIQLLVDDGVESLGHRKNLLNKDYTSMGASFDDHQIYNCMCVMNFANNWKDK